MGTQQVETLQQIAAEYLRYFTLWYQDFGQINFLRLVGDG
jgi:hypothetical protein